MEWDSKLSALIEEVRYMQFNAHMKRAIEP